MKLLLGIGAAALVLVLGFFIFGFISGNNAGAGYESSIRAYERAVTVALTNVRTSVQESAQIPEMAKNDIAELIVAATEGTFGDDGARSAFLAIQQNYPGQIDPALYRNIQTMIQSGRANFSAAQNDLTDQVRIYERALESYPSKFFLGLAGYPKIELAQYGVIADSTTQNIMVTRTDQPLVLN